MKTLLLSPKLSNVCVVLSWMVLTACGGGGGTVDAGVSATGDAEKPSVVSGNVVSPDGTTPLGSVLIYVKDGVVPAGGSNPALTCGTPPNASWPATCTAADGSFSLEAVLPASSASLTFEKGRFTYQSALPQGQPAQAPLQTVTMSAEAVGARIAVVHGRDALQHTLAALGLGTLTNGNTALDYGTETFTIYNGDMSSLSVSGIKNWDQLFVDLDGDGKPELDRYAMLLISVSDWTRLAGDPMHSQTLRTWVANGGHLFANGPAMVGSSAAVVEAAFPEYIDWGGTTTEAINSPEAPLVRLSSPSVHFDTYGQTDTALSQWLADKTCVRFVLDPIATGSCFDVPGLNLFAVDNLGHFNLATEFAPILGAHEANAAAMRVLVDGKFYLDGNTDPIFPLAVTFTHGLGRVTYASFTISPPGSLPAGLTPHARFLQYVVFEL